MKKFQPKKTAYVDPEAYIENITAPSFYDTVNFADLSRQTTRRPSKPSTQ
jgi:hypothetical protein